jgi:hypothetical protein
MNEQEIIDMFTHFYEVDMQNCLMTHADWIEEVAKALTDKEYLNKMRAEYKTYLKMIKS